MKEHLSLNRCWPLCSDIFSWLPRLFFWAPTNFNCSSLQEFLEDHKNMDSLINISIDYINGRCTCRCPWSNLPWFERMFLTLIYIHITKHNYIRSWKVMEIILRQVISNLSSYNFTNYHRHIETRRNSSFNLVLLPVLSIWLIFEWNKDINYFRQALLFS